MKTEQEWKQEHKILCGYSSVEGAWLAIDPTIPSHMKAGEWTPMEEMFAFDIFNAKTAYATTEQAAITRLYERQMAKNRP